MIIVHVVLVLVVVAVAVVCMCMKSNACCSCYCCCCLATTNNQQLQMKYIISYLIINFYSLIKVLNLFISFIFVVIANVVAFGIIIREKIYTFLTEFLVYLCSAVSVCCWPFVTFMYVLKSLFISFIYI